ncbi:sensor histidine kinase, partial [Micromonospora zhanjiangensis]
PPRRSTRDWLVDSVFFLCALGCALLILADTTAPRPELAPPIGPGWFTPVDGVLSLAACGALWVRRRWPVALAWATMPLSLFSVASSVALLVIAFTVVVHRRLAVAAPVLLTGLTTGLVHSRLRPDADMDYWMSVVWGVLITGAVLTWGMFVRARRQLVVSLRDRADRAEAEQQLRVAQARQLERTRIARELHDVLAHRISLLSLHAGALEFRPDAPSDEVARAAGVIRTSAHAALQDLREVIGVLREHSSGAGDGPPERPQPTLADVPALVTECRAAGVRVEVDQTVADPRSVPAGIGRSAYRIVQE